jgi:hypothetical protein
MSHRALSPEQFGNIPPEPGSQPIPEGHVRIFHQTWPRHVESIREQGLRRDLSSASSESPVVFGSAGTPDYDMTNRPHVEFHADPTTELDIGSHVRGTDPAEHVRQLEKRRSTVTMQGDVPPSSIVAIHEPWHAHVREIESDPRSLHDYTEGMFKETSTGDPEADKALAHVRAKHAAGGYQ